MATAIMTPVPDDPRHNVVALANARHGHLLDARGWKRASSTLPGANKGRKSPTKGRKYPPDPPTTDEIVRFVQAIPTDTRYGRRMVALVVLLWRTGLRISEALDLDESDLNPREGSVLVKHGKGGKRRKVGMDPWGWDQMRPWLDERAQLPTGKVFCVLEGPTAYRRPWNRHDVNAAFRAYEVRSGVRRRMAPHQFRHRLACDWVRAGVPMPMLQRQLGHANLQVTTIYLQGINVEEVLDVSRTMPAPVMPLPDLGRPGAKSAHDFPLDA